MRIGHLFTTLHAVAIVAAVALFIQLAARTTGSLRAAVAAGIAIGVSPLFPATLAPPWEAAAFAASTAVGLSLAASQSRRRTLVLASVAAVFALLVPAAAIAAALAAGVMVASTWPHGTRSVRLLSGAASAASVGALVWVLLLLLPPDALAGPSSWRAAVDCMLRVQNGAPSAPLTQSLALARWLLGPVVLGLASLGIFVEVRRSGLRRALISAAAALALFAPAAAGVSPPQLVMTPAFVGAWWLAAVGLHETLAMVGRGTWPGVVAACLLVLLPVLQISRRQAEERDDIVRPIGHEMATMAELRAMLNVAAPGAMFAEEDASLDVLLRASVFAGRRAGKPFTVVPRTRESIGRALAAGTVYAWPFGQQDLSERGFVIELIEVRTPTSDRRYEVVSGLATISGVRPCVAVEDRWVDVTPAIVQGRVSLVADSETDGGPLVLLVGASMPIESAPDAWSLRVLRGFRVATFEQPNGGPTNRLLTEARSNRLPADHPILSAPFVARVRLHRTPRAPLTLPVLLGRGFTQGIARLTAPTTDGRLTLCDAPKISIAPIASRAGL
jgi:hypothetical protein